MRQAAWHPRVQHRSNSVNFLKRNHKNSSEFLKLGLTLFLCTLKMKVSKTNPATIAAVATKRTSQTQDTNGATPPAHKREPDALTKEATEADDPDIQHCVWNKPIVPVFQERIPISQVNKSNQKMLLFSIKDLASCLRLCRLKLQWAWQSGTASSRASSSFATSSRRS